MRTRILSGSKAPTARLPSPRSASGAPATAPTRPDPAAAAERGALVARDLRTSSDAPLVLGRYRLRRRLGTGGFATVWLAQDERLDRQVAVKILPRAGVAGGRAGDGSGGGRDGGGRAGDLGGRFEREARAAARLAHPGIVTLYEAAVDDEGAYLVSELVHGTTLAELLEAGRLSDRDAVRIGIALCDALAHAHAHGVIHRDVKPTNVLVPERPTTPAGLARLTDFGVARLIGPAHRGDALTRTGDVIGTEAYMAPEQAQGLPAGAAADLFSLALVLYEALSGVNPLRSAVSRRRPSHLPPLRRQRRELPRELGQAIDLALRPRPSERGTLAELRAALVASVGRTNDEPGVITAPWPARTLTRTGPADDEALNRDSGQEVSAERRRRRPERAPAGRSEMPTAAVPWPRRALAALATAALAAWVLHHVPGAGPGPGTLAIAVAAALVLALPRAGWVILATAAAAALIVATRPGGALVLLAGAVVPMLASPLDGPAWPLAVAAPALGAVGLAAAWPAVAGLSRRAHRRAALGATGYVWTALVTNGIGSAETLPDGLHHVLAPLATVGTPITAAIWAAAALTLPLTRSRRWPALECLRLALWATGLALATLASEHAAGAVHTRSVLLGAGVGALVALVTRRSGTRLSQARSGNDRPPLA